MCVGTWLHEEQGKINPVQNYAIGGSNCWYFGELLLLLQPSGACKRDETHHFFFKGIYDNFLSSQLFGGQHPKQFLLFTVGGEGASDLHHVCWGLLEV